MVSAKGVERWPRAFVVLVVIVCGIGAGHFQVEEDGDRAVVLNVKGFSNELLGIIRQARSPTPI